MAATGVGVIPIPVSGDAHLIEQVAAHYGWGSADLAARSEITSIELANTFGPQWEPIVALVRRAALITYEEIPFLISPDDARAAWSVAQDAAWYAGRVDAQNAAQNAARNAAHNAARAAYQDKLTSVRRDAAYAVWDAAPCRAARALAVRDRIGLHGFEQAHYDLLTGPWARVIGPVHPDDTTTERTV